MLYLPNPDNLDQINHRDGNPLNNNVDNLEWCTTVVNNRLRHTKNGIRRYGVWKHKDKWRTRLQFNNKKSIEIGVFKDKEEAYQAFYETYKQYYGEAPW